MSESSRTPKETILVVDDNEANRDLARATLEDEGYEVLIATGGREGLALFERRRPDCILLDIRMPEMDGFTVCENIRAIEREGESEGAAGTPIVFLTALRDVDTFDRAISAGGDDFLTKPVRPTELVVRVRTSLALRRLRTQLAEHYDLLRHQRDDLLRAQLQKERLSAFLVHDLKNPVNAMDLNAQMLLRNRSLDEDAKKFAARIRTEARHLTRLILNLLDLSKGDEGKLVPSVTEVDLSALIAEVQGELEADARSRDVELATELATTRLVADPDLVRRMLTNMLENALRHAPRGTRVTVKSAQVEGTSELRVEDHGPGVPEEKRARVFDPFLQLEGSSPDSRGGRGLGLAFCKLVAEAHGGSIRVEDASPGAAFCVRFPR